LARVVPRGNDGGLSLHPHRPPPPHRHLPAVQIKPFLKCVNYNHVMPTRYALDVELKSIVTSDVVSGSNPTARQNSRKEVKKILEDKHAQHCAQAALPCGPTMRPRWARQGQDGPATTRLAPPGQRRRTL
jgi:hypothetical protein